MYLHIVLFTKMLQCVHIVQAVHIVHQDKQPFGVMHALANYELRKPWTYKKLILNISKVFHFTRKAHWLLAEQINEWIHKPISSKGVDLGSIHSRNSKVI